MLAAAMVYTAEDPRAANEAFNVSNGDVFRWRQVRLLSVYLGVFNHSVIFKTKIHCFLCRFGQSWLNFLGAALVALCVQATWARQWPRTPGCGRD